MNDSVISAMENARPNKASVSRAEDIFSTTLARAVDRRGVLLLGVCNVTPDSFSDGGDHATTREACAWVDELLAQGADMVDVGGESTRPGATPVPVKEQLERVLEVVRYAARKVAVSIDTTSAEVADACVEAGACAVNDVSCGRSGDLAKVAAERHTAYILMHSRGTQEEMSGFSTYPDEAYGDVVIDVLGEWSEAASHVRDAGVPPAAIVMDPGLGFAKNARHSAEILRRMPEIVSASSVPVLVGASRKSFLKAWDADAEPKERLGASLAAAIYAVRAGAKLVRVHDVRATRQAVDTFVSLENVPPARDTDRLIEIPHV
jgi:dihydropteroate synthase